MTLHRTDVTFSHAQEAWSSGVLACDAGRLVENYVDVENDRLRLGELDWDLGEIERIRVVGAGKAAHAMVDGLHRALGMNIRLEKRVSGWVNRPEWKSGAPGKKALRGVPDGGPVVWSFPARPVGENLPTENSYGGTLLIEDIVESTGPDELCLALISGGGSALLTHPAGKIQLQDMCRLISWLSARGASIGQLNTVRKQISEVKGGRLAARFRGGHLASLIVSDVLHHGLEFVASGPTVQDSTTAMDALSVLEQFDPQMKFVPGRILEHLKQATSGPVQVPANVSNHLIGDIRTAVGAAQVSLEKRGYECVTEIQADEFEEADQAGRRLAHWLLKRQDTSHPVALISGGEPVVRLSAKPGRGGRNQQLVLAAVDELLKVGVDPEVFFTMISAGTDGEDGNTDVAGAAIDSRMVAELVTRKSDPAPFLSRNDAFSFFSDLAPDARVLGVPEASTNVCDLRVVLVAPKALKC